MKLRVTPCFRCRMLRVGVLMAPVALLSSWLPAREPASALRWLAAWLALYALICVVWWAIIQRRRWMTTQGPASD